MPGSLPIRVVKVLQSLELSAECIFVIGTYGYLVNSETACAIRRGDQVNNISSTFDIVIVAIDKVI